KLNLRARRRPALPPGVLAGDAVIRAPAAAAGNPGPGRWGGRLRGIRRALQDEAVVICRRRGVVFRGE
ncbi:MAG TPA: hypothetical protein PLP17_09255, partial [Oligoflexia bacterium]|nr:hypothetical protein [Oligoflexia bacterium]